jgi:hypothetical protein
MSWDLVAGGFTSCTETFMILFSSLAFYFVLKGKNSGYWKYWLFISGISIGFSIAFKQIAITSTLSLFLIFIYIYSNLSRQSKFYGIIIIFFGILISTFVSLFPLILSGVTLKDYFEGAWMILFNSNSSATFPIRFNGFITIWLFSRVVIFYPFLFLLFFQKKLWKNLAFVGLLIWFLFDFIGTNSSGYFFNHQIKQLIPSLSVIIGIVLGNLVENDKRIKLSFDKYVSIITILIIIILFPEKESLKKGMNNAFNKTNNYNKEIGIWLQNNSKNNDKVYITGTQGNVILYYSDRISSSKYINSIFVSGLDEKNNILSDLETNSPKFILMPDINVETTPNLGKGFDEFIKKNYTFLKNMHNYYIFKKNPLLVK